jgi:parallel beta-helix repeat protein
MTGRLYIANNTNLIGSGRNNSILFAAAGAPFHMVYLQGRKNIVIRDLCLDMNNGSKTGTNDNYSIIDIRGTTTVKSNNITISNCNLRNGLIKAMIDCEEYTEYITIENCNIGPRQIYIGGNDFGYGGGIWFSGQYCRALYNFIFDTCAAGVVVESAALAPISQGHLIEGNRMVGYMASGVWMESGYHEKAANCTITKNNIGPINSSAYWVDEGHWSYGILCGKGSTVSYNNIKGVNKFGIYINSGTGDNTLVIGNTISGVELATTSAGILDKFGNSIIKDNIIKNEGTQRMAKGILIYTEKGPTLVEGNNISNCDLSGIHFQDGNYTLSIINNIVGYCDDYEIYASNDEAKTIIMGNIIYQSDSAAIRVDNQEYTVVSGNCINGATAGSATAIYLMTCKNCTVTSNTIENGTLGIRLYKTCNTTVTGNVVRTSSVGYSIYEDTAPADMNLILGNKVYRTMTIIGAHTICVDNLGYLSTVPTVNMTAYNIRAGFMWYSVAENKLYIYDGTAWDNSTFV